MIYIQSSRQLITGVPEARVISECYGNLRKLLSEITDSLVWDYVVGIYPSFQASKDYAPLNSNLSTSSTINSKFESINDLLRNKKLPNSLTVHRREIIITDSSHNKMKESVCIAMFDTYTHRAARNDKTGNDELIMAQIAEDECALLKTQVKGHIRKLNITANIDADESWSADSEICSMLKALSPFFVPTGKTSILGKTSHEGHYPPTPKLFSMVLSVRDQPQIYACSLVMYRRVELIKSLELNTMGNAKITSFNTTPGATELKERTSSAGLQTKLKGFRTKPTFSNDYAGSRMSNVTENQDLKNVHTTLDLASYQLSESTASIESTHFGIQTELSLPQSDLVIVSNVTAGSLDTDTVFISQASVNSTLSIDSPTGFYRPNILINFSDDESAGLISSAILDLPPTPKICHLDSEMGAKSLQATAVQRHGSFTEFLAATATATVSAASAIALQAGVLPKPTFSWTPSSSNMSQAIKPTDSKGFYDNLYLSRFSMMKFANSQAQQQTGTNSESGLKRKYDGFNFTETILFGEEKVVAFDEGLNYQATSSESLSSSIYSESSVPLIISGRDSTPSARGYDYSPDKPSLSSYPKFRHVKLLKRSILLPHSPSRSPRHKNNIRAQIKRSRAASFTTIPRLEASSLDYSSKRMAFDSVVTDGENTIHKNTTDNSLELEILADLSNLHLAPDSSVPIEEKYKTADLSSAKISHDTIGVGYMAHGICLFTQDPAVGKLRDAAAAIASDIHHLSILGDDSSAAVTLSESIEATVINSLRKFADAEVIASSSSSSRYGEQAKDYNSKLILDALSPKNLVTVLVAFLLEYRIVVVSSRSLSAATHLGEFLKEAIYPLKYSHVYSPLVPPSIGLQLIHCPAPFFIGMKRSSAIDEVIELEDERDREKNIGRRNRNASGRDHGCGLLVVDMDRDECSLPQDLCAPVRAAKVLIRALESLLHPELSNCDEITKVSGRQHDLSSSDTLIMRVLDLCGQFVTSTLQGLESCCLKVDEGQERIVLFDELMFLQQHINRFTLQSPAISKIFKVLDGQTLSTDRLETKKDESAVPNELNRDGLSDKDNILPYDASLSASSCRDVEKLIRSLMRTQSFSSYLTA